MSQRCRMADSRLVFACLFILAGCEGTRHVGGAGTLTEPYAAYPLGTTLQQEPARLLIFNQEQHLGEHPSDDRRFVSVDGVRVPGGVRVMTLAPGEHKIEASISGHKRTTSLFSIYPKFKKTRLKAVKTANFEPGRPYYLSRFFDTETVLSSQYQVAVHWAVNKWPGERDFLNRLDP